MVEMIAYESWEDRIRRVERRAVIKTTDLFWGLSWVFPFSCSFCSFCSIRVGL